jgi:F-type H+-transporting ATPase subunit b
MVENSMVRGWLKWVLLCMMALSPGWISACRALDEGHAPKYHVEYLDDQGRETATTFDLSKPAEAEHFHQLMVSGKIVKANVEHIPGIDQLFSLRWDLGLWTLVVFGLLLLILSKTAWPSMLEGLKKREQNISDAVSSAENARNDAERIRLQLAGEMAKANDNIRAMMDEARKDATSAKEDLLTTAKTEIATERDRLRREIDAARDQALLDIYNQSTQLAAMISSKTLQREVRPEDHKRFFDEALAEFKGAASTAGNSMRTV